MTHNKKSKLFKILDCQNKTFTNLITLLSPHCRLVAVGSLSTTNPPTILDSAITYIKPDGHTAVLTTNLSWLFVSFQFNCRSATSSLLITPHLPPAKI